MSADVVVGVVGNDVPRQLLLAAGAVPRRLMGSWSGSIDETAAEMLGATDPVVARILTDLLAGAADDLGAIVICNDSQAHLRLFYVLRMLSGTTLPPVHLVDLPRRDSAAARAFTAEQFRATVDVVSTITGRRPDAASLLAAAESEARVSGAAALMRDRRRQSPAAVSGTTALAANLRAMASSPDDAVAAFDSAVAEQPGARRLFMTGSTHPDASFYDAIEREGFTIVAEDHDSGDLAWIGVGVTSGDLEVVCAELADHHFARDLASPVALIADRARSARDRAGAAQAEVAVALLRAGDDAPAWDAASVRDALADVGIPLLVRTVDVGDDPAAIARSIAVDAAEGVAA